MANNVLNVWKISNIPQNQIQYLLDKLTIVIKSHNDDKDVEINKRIIDFDLIIPEPKLKRDCPKKFRINEKSCVQEDKERPWFNWYDWRNHYWNTKWGAYDGYTIVGKTYIKFVFNTAWNFAEPIARELAKLGYNLEIRYADECLGSNCNKLLYDAELKEWENVPLPNKYSFANTLWNRY